MQQTLWVYHSLNLHDVTTNLDQVGQKQNVLGARITPHCVNSGSSQKSLKNILYAQTFNVKAQICINHKLTHTQKKDQRGLKGISTVAYLSPHINIQRLV